MSVRLKVILIVLAAVVAVTLGNLGMVLLFTQKNLVEITEADLKSIAQVADEYVTTEMRLLKADAAGAAQYIDTSTSDDLTAELDAQIKRYEDFIGMAILDRSGTVAEAGLHSASRDTLDSSIAQRAFAGEAVISTTRYAEDGALVLDVCVPMRAGRVLVATIDGMYFSNLISDIRVWDTGNLFIVDENGTTVASVWPHMVSARLNFVDEAQNDAQHDDVGSFIANMIKGEPTSGLYFMDGQKRLCFGVPITGSQVGWTLGVAAPLDESPITHLRAGLLWSELFFLIIGAIAAVLVSKRIARPVEEEYCRNRELAELKAEAERASEAKSIFLANTSHEMRTPLNAIIGLSELQLLEEHDEATQADLVKMHNAGTTLLNIINDILDISKIESGKFDIVPVDYDVASLINDTVMVSMMRIGSKPIEFVLKIDENLPASLNGDELRVKQIFNNLLSNAFKYTREGSVTWEIGYERCGGAAGSAGGVGSAGVGGAAAAGSDARIHLVARIIDTGIGIKPEDIEKLFGDYNQVDVKSNRSIEGTGLGLAITRRLLAIMGGSIGVESVYGEGSVFTVRIPQGFVADVPIGAQTVANLQGFRYVESKRSSNEALSDLQLPSARVLVVDDNQTNLAVARGMMKRFGMQVDCVDNGQAAIELINKGKQRYHAIFMDHMMPGMDGIETFERIRALGTAYATSVPVIALTANAISGNAEMFTDKGFAAFLSKPMDIMQLELIIRRWIRDGEAESDSQPQEREQEQLRPRAQEEPQERVQVWPQEQPREQRQPRTQGQQGQAGRPQLQKAPSLSPYSLIAVLGDCGIDVESALERFGGQAEEYLRVLRVYLADTERLLLELNDPSEQELGAYAIVVHGIKGSSRGVGAMRIAREAEELERAAKSGEHELVLRLNEGFVERAQEFIEDASRALDSLGYCEGKEFKESPDAALLEQLCEAAARFSIDGVEDALEALEDYDYQTEGELVAWLRVQCDALAFDEIVVRLSDFGNVGSANAGNARNVSTIRKGESNDYRAAS